MFTNDHNFHFVIQLPADFEVYDFSQGYDPNRTLSSPYGIGKYAENRPGMYKGDLFESDQRTIHMGIDIAAPIGTSIHSFADGTIHCFGINPQPFDYGPTIITKHVIEDITIYALFGHLSLISLKGKKHGQKIKKGEVIASLGRKEENGGWNPHLHFQLSLIEPKTHDLPGVVHKDQLLWALENFPDPRIVLGPLY